MDLMEALSATPQNTRVLASKMGCSMRDVAIEVQEARLEGLPVCSSTKGYWLGTASEVYDCAERLRARALIQLDTADALANAAERM